MSDDSLDLVVTGFDLGAITTNARAILEAVKAKLAGYKAENYSGERIQEAKRDKAELNAAAKALNDKRIEYERAFMKPFDEFKGLITETCNEIKKASSAIDFVVKEVEQAEMEEKRGQIDEYFASMNVTLFRLAQVFSPRWLNKTYLLRDIKAEIVARIEKVKADLVILDRINEPEAKAHYLSTLDLNGAIAAADRIKANRERLAAAEKPVAMEAPIIDSTPGPSEELRFDAPAEEPTFTYTLRFRGTKEALRGLRSYMEEHNITYEKLEEV